jgi:hypothetical protein
MKGLGDNVYQRPFIRALARRRPVYLETPFPEIYADLPGVHFVKTGTPLRTQRKHENAVDPGMWSPLPRSFVSRQVHYGSRDLAAFSIPRALERQIQLNGSPVALDLPIGLLRAPAARNRPIAFVRPVTARREWLNTARNPDPAYVAAVAADLRRTHHVILAADLESGAEDLVGTLPPHDEAFLRGELALPDLLGLVAAADVVVGGVGWIVPVSIALRRPCFVILGGHGAHNAPDRLVDPRFDLSRIAFAMPDRFCLCDRMTHRCDKTNSRLSPQWETFRRMMLS